MSYSSMAVSSVTCVGLTIKDADCKVGLLMTSKPGGVPAVEQAHQQGVLRVHPIARLLDNDAVGAVQHAVRYLNVAPHREAVHETSIVGARHDLLAHNPVLQP